MTIEADPRDDQTIRVPTVEESLSIEKQRVDTGRVRATSAVSSQETMVREHLSTTSIRVERVPIDRLVDIAPLPRTEGSRTILSVTEEVLVKRIRVIEEVHLISEDQTNLYEETVTLRRLDVRVERLGAERDEASVDPNSSTKGQKT